MFWQRSVSNLTHPGFCITFGARPTCSPRQRYLCWRTVIFTCRISTGRPSGWFMHLHTHSHQTRTRGKAAPTHVCVLALQLRTPLCRLSRVRLLQALPCPGMSNSDLLGFFFVSLKPLFPDCVCVCLLSLTRWLLQALYKACLYDEAMDIVVKLDNPDLHTEIMKLQVLKQPWCLC